VHYPPIDPGGPGARPITLAGAGAYLTISVSPSYAPSTPHRFYNFGYRVGKLRAGYELAG
jgi:hypothetical protein